MQLTCPGCSQPFDSREPSRVGETDVSCPACRATVTVVTTVKIAKTPDVKAGRSLSPKPTVLVAVEGTATKEMIQEVLTAGGYDAVLVSTGKEALTALERVLPSVALLDVGLPEIMGFELCERIKKIERFKDLKVILVASIYDKKRYKREPDSLYGADDYIERHDIQDRLLSKIQDLVDKRSTVTKETPSLPGPVPAEHKPAPPVGKTTPAAPAARDNTDSIFLEEATVYEPGLHAPKPVARPHAAPAPMETSKNPLEEVTVYEPGLHAPKPVERPHAAPAPMETSKNPLEEATVYEPGLHAPKPVARPHAAPAPMETSKNPLEEATVYEPGLHAPKPVPRPPATPAPVGAAKNPAASGDPKHEAAKRLARLILSDIGLYNPRAVEQGIRNNTFQQLLKNELEEGRKLYLSRVSSDVTPDYYNEAIEEYIQKRKGSS